MCISCCSRLRAFFYFLLIASVILLGIGLLSPAHGQDELTVVENWLYYTDTENALYHHSVEQAFDLLDRRKSTVGDYVSDPQWKNHQEEVRATLHEIVGPFPKKTPLNARTVRTLEKDDYSVEHIIYESMPDFFVTSSLYIPADRNEPAPAILYVSGHSNTGYRSDTYQHVILNLVQKGFVVFAIDPYGQGERLQYFDEQASESFVGGPTDEHSYAGAQVFLTGQSPGRYMAWDGIRAIDYLTTRPEVDASRIGVTGRSGGGTQTAYIAAFDDRVRAAAPENYITNFRRLLEAIGPQDAEQNFFHGLARHIDHADLLEVRAPRPTLIITTTRDYFSIQGARETFREVQRAYTAFNAEENIRLISDDAEHSSTQANRERMYAFFQNHLANPGSSADRNVELLTAEELQVTETGQVSTSIGGETVFSLNQERARRLADQLDQRRENLDTHLPSTVRSARYLSGFRPPKKPQDVVFRGRHKREGYVVEKYFMDGEGDYPIPFLLMIPEGDGPHPAVVYVHPDGKQAESGPDQEIEWLVDQGYAVLAPDLLGIGEMGTGALKGDSFIEGISYNRWFASILIGRSIVGMQAGDLLRTVSYLENRADITRSEIVGVARGALTPTLLHAAAFDSSLANIVCIDPLISYESLARNRRYDPRYIPAAVAGALEEYDLPDLSANLTPRRLLMVNLRNHQGKRVTEDHRTEEMSVVRRAYRQSDAEGALEITQAQSQQQFHRNLQEWLGEEQ